MNSRKYYERPHIELKKQLLTFHTLFTLSIERKPFGIRPSLDTSIIWLFFYHVTLTFLLAYLRALLCRLVVLVAQLLTRGGESICRQMRRILSGWMRSCHRAKTSDPPSDYSAVQGSFLYCTTLSSPSTPLPYRPHPSLRLHPQSPALR